MTSTESVTPAGAPAARLAACSKAVAAFLDEELQALADAARQPFFIAARDAGDPDEEERQVAFMEEVDALCPRAGETFSAAVLDGLHSPAGALSVAQDSDPGGLNLVETAKVDDWVRLRRLLERQADDDRSAEESLWARVTHAGGLAADAGENPLSLQGVCVLFQGAMQNLGASREARGAIYDAFEATVVVRLVDLIGELDALIDGRADAPADEGQYVLSDDTSIEPAAKSASSDTTGVVVEDSDTRRSIGAFAGALREVGDATDAGGQDDGGVGESRADFEAALMAAIAARGGEPSASQSRAAALLAGALHEVIGNREIESDLRHNLRRLAPTFMALSAHDEADLQVELAGARHDAVTGLLDRPALHTRLDATLRRGTGVAMCSIGVDEFRDIAKRCGPQVAGRLLRTLGELLRKQARSTVLAARIDTDEFAVAIPAAAADAGRRFAKGYLKALRAARFAIGDEQLRLGVSIGVVERDAGLDSAPELMQAAQRTRRAAQDAGGACFKVHGEDEPDA